MNELNQSRVSMSIHIIVAIIIGWLSAEVAAMSRSLFAIMMGLAVLYVVGFVAQKATGREGIKWWAANGMIIYLFVWFISWTLFYNLGIA